MRSPWFFVPSLYFQQGLPVLIVQQFSILFYKRMGIPNEEIALWTSLIAWPWILKMAWGPMVDLRSSKRKWVLFCQLGVTLALALAGFLATSNVFLPATLLVFVLMAFLSATHDIALDGYYLLALKKEQQAFFVGIRSTFFRLAMIFATGTLVVLAGTWEKSGTEIAQSWQNALYVAAALYGALMLYAHWAMPKLSTDRPAINTVAREQKPPFEEAWVSFFKQDRILTILLFILLYRFGESMLSKMSGLFLLDPRSAGGLGLDTVQAGNIIGNVGIISLTIGGLLGGFAIARFGLRACIWPMVLSMNIPNLFYVWAAYTQPGVSAVYAIIAIDQFGYGFGLASYMVYVMYLCQGSRYQTSHYAIATAGMALGAMAAGIVSGFLQKYLGYFGFFTAVCFFTIPGMILLQRIPMDFEKMIDPKLALAED